MRKRNKRFVLRRETLRTLDQAELVRAPGQNDTTMHCFEGSWCACETEQACSGTTGSLCLSVTVCSNC